MVTYNRGNNKYSDVFDTGDYEEIIENNFTIPSSDLSLNLSYLHEFEARHGAGSIWRSISGDRTLVKRGWTGRFHDDRSPYNHEQLLTIAESQLRTIRDLFDKYDFDFVFAQSWGNINVLLAHQIAVEKEIPWFYSAMTRVADHRALFEEMENKSPQLHQAKKRLESQPSKLHSDTVDNYIERVQDGEPAYYQSSMDIDEGENSPSRTKIFDWITKLPDALLEYYQINYGNKPSGRVSRLERRYFTSKKKIKENIQKYTVDYDEFDPDQSYVHFPLHAQPERSLMIWTRYYQDFPAVVKNIAQSLPVGMELYVNDHPIMGGVRSSSFYDDLRRFPNVRVISPEVPTSRISTNADSVLTISSTVGLEALVNGVPVVALGEPCYNILDTVQSINSYDEIPEAIQTAVNSDVDMQELRAYVAASFEVGCSRADPEFELRVCEDIERRL
jgi:hypothetical protein